jgi:hypothetical protein
MPALSVRRQVSDETLPTAAAPAPLQQQTGAPLTLLDDPAVTRTCRRALCCCCAATLGQGQPTLAGSHSTGHGPIVSQRERMFDLGDNDSVSSAIHS